MEVIDYKNPGNVGGTSKDEFSYIDGVRRFFSDADLEYVARDMIRTDLQRRELRERIVNRDLLSVSDARITTLAGIYRLGWSFVHPIKTFKKFSLFWFMADLYR